MTTISLPDQTSVTAEIGHTPCYQRAIVSLTRAVVDAEYIGMWEASVAKLSLRYVLLDDRLSHEPGLDRHETSLWSFAEADRLVEDYRAAQIVEASA